MNIKQLRKEKNLTADYVAEKLNMPVSTYYGYEQNKRQMHTATLKQLASILEVDFNKLLDNYADNSKIEKPSTFGSSLQTQYDMAMKVIQDEIAFLHRQLQNKEELIMSQSKTISTLAEALGKLGGKPLKPHQMAKIIALQFDESFTQVA